MERSEITAAIEVYEFELAGDLESTVYDPEKLASANCPIETRIDNRIANENFTAAGLKAFMVCCLVASYTRFANKAVKSISFVCHCIFNSSMFYANQVHNSLLRFCEYKITTKAFAPVDIDENNFTITSNVPNVKVSWLATGVRKDDYANNNRFVVDIEKEEGMEGKRLHQTNEARRYILLVNRDLLADIIN